MKKRIRPEDPEFTTLALGEATAEEAANWEIAPEDQEAFDDLKAFSSELSGELSSRSAPETLGENRVQSIRETMNGENRYKVARFPVWISTAAACLAVGMVSLYVFHEDRPEVFHVRPVPITLAPMSDESKKQDVDRVDESLAAKEDSETLPADRGGTEPSKMEQKPPIENRINVEAQAQLPEIAAAEERRPSSPPAIPEADLPTLEIESIEGYRATSTLAGTQLKTHLPDVGASVTIVSEKQMNSFHPAPDAYITVEPRPTTPQVESYNREQTLQLSQFKTEASADQGYQATKTLAGKQMNTPLPYRDSSFAIVSLPTAPQVEPYNREGYAPIEESGYKSAVDSPLSTFSIDVDTASYTNVRRFIESGRLPIPDAVRIEEMVNYFRYDYPEPQDDRPFSTQVHAATAPWNPDHRLVRIALKGKTPAADERPDANLVFLVDVSGSMNRPSKLPLVKESLKLLVSQLEVRDRIAVVVYAGASGLALPSTTANNQETITHAIDHLQAGGSTNGGAGIELAYKVAQQHFVKEGINRVILCTDGDFNVGVSDRGSLTRMIQEKAKSGVFFTALGFGMGNLQDDMLETLSNKGNGFYGYIDSRSEARKLFIEEMIGSLQTIAKDVKIQVEFNPAQVAAYRLIGYENRALNKEDFNDDKKDAGEIGAGHSVTAFYEVIPAGVEVDAPTVDPLKYQTNTEPQDASEEMLTVKLRYKEPDGDTSTLIETPFIDKGERFEDADDDFRFGASVAVFGMLLRGSEHVGNATYNWVLQTASKALATDPGGHRGAFLDLVGQAKTIALKASSTIGLPREE